MKPRNSPTSFNQTSATVAKEHLLALQKTLQHLRFTPQEQLSLLEIVSKEASLLKRLGR